MRTSIALDTSPTTILRSLRGQIVGARIAYPEVPHIEVCDDAGDLWRFATQDAEFAPADPGALIGRTLEEAGIDPITTELRFRLSDGAKLVVAPGSEAAADDPPNWELITPDHLTLEFGPGLRWQIGEVERR
ncbi:MAG TPA: hypothetical protein VHV53_01950 [Solirubrobacterales bacterium]|nr:hypothetical protein [Solirubrobacterales bacterium]